MNGKPCLIPIVHCELAYSSPIGIGYVHINRTVVKRFNHVSMPKNFICIRLTPYAINTDPVLIPQNAASDQDLHYVLTGIKFLCKYNVNEKILQKILKLEADSF